MAKLDRNRVIRALCALVSGIVFGLGLAVAQMTDPRVVLAFLDLFGAWDARLLFVLGGAVVTALMGFRLVLCRAHPLFSDRFALPSKVSIDAPLLVGAVVFGIGWGLVGYCPGPAIASIGSGNFEAWIVVPAMIAGTALQRLNAKRTERRADAAGSVESVSG